MYCIPPESRHPFMCAKDKDIIDYWNYIQKYKNTFAPFAEYYALARYVKENRDVIVPELPIRMSEYEKPEYFYDAIAVKIAYDITSEKPEVEYYFTGTKLSKNEENGVRIVIYPNHIPGVAIESTVDTLVRLLQSGYVKAEILGAKIEEKNYSL